MSVNQELYNIIKQIKFIRNIKQADVAVMLGVKSTYLSDMINSRVPYSENMKMKIFEVFSDCFSTGIFHGSNTISDNISNTSTHVHNIASNSDSACDGCTSGGASSESSPPESTAETIDIQDVSMVRLIPISVQGGPLNDFDSQVRPHDCELMISPIKGVDFAIQVSGDSMAPEYPEGSRVFVKRIKDGTFIEWGRVFVLNTCNGTVLKVLDPSDKENCVRRISLNPDPRYAPFDVNMNDVYGIYRVLLCMSMK